MQMGEKKVLIVGDPSPHAVAFLRRRMEMNGFKLVEVGDRVDAELVIEIRESERSKENWQILNTIPYEPEDFEYNSRSRWNDRPQWTPGGGAPMKRGKRR